MLALAVEADALLPFHSFPAEFTTIKITFVIVQSRDLPCPLITSSQSVVINIIVCLFGIEGIGSYGGIQINYNNYL